MFQGVRPMYKIERDNSDNWLDQLHVCKTLTLVDDSSNCYRQIILPLSISHECVMRSILAVGALHLSLSQPANSVDNYFFALHQKQRTLQWLRLDIASSNGVSRNHVLVAMLMLCLFDARYLHLSLETSLTFLDYGQLPSIMVNPCFGRCELDWNWWGTRTWT
jgi:hypothetical protein